MTKCQLLKVIAVMLITATGVAAMAQDKLPTLLPKPQSVKYTNKVTPLTLRSINRFILPSSCIKAAAGIDMFNDKFVKQGGTAIRKSGIATQPCTAGTIWLGTSANPVVDHLFKGMPEPAQQGYRVAVGDNWVVISGKDVQGLYYGLMTLIQLLQSDNTIPQLRISDWPELQMRGTYICDTNPEQKIAYFSSLKLNFMVFEYADLYQLDKPEVAARWRNIAKLCRQHFIEPIPELQSLGHGNVVLSIEPRCQEGIHINNYQVVAKAGTIQADDLSMTGGSINNAGFEQANGSSPTGWTIDTLPNGVSVDTSVKNTGNASLKITRTDRGQLRAWQNVKCESHAVYELSVHAKTQGVTSDAGITGAYIEVYGVTPEGDLSPGPLGMSKQISGDNDWTTLSFQFNSIAYNTLCVFVRLQNAYGTVWYDDLQMRGISRDRKILNNPIIGPAVLKSADGKTIYEPTSDYQILDIQQKASPDSPSIVIPTGSRISEGQHLLADFDAMYSGYYTCCPSEPLYQQLMRKSIHNVIQCMQPTYLHIGHDEPQLLNEDSRCRSRHLTNAEIYADDAKRMNDYMHEADPKCRMMMWDDPLNPYSNAPAFHLEKASQLLPKDIIMNAWAYSYPAENEKIVKSIDFWVKQGFDITGSPWFDHDNCRFWSEQLIKNRNSKHILGLFYTAWSDLPDKRWGGLEVSADSSWSGVKPSDK